jgi:LPS export ABC transporter protein LptC
MKRHLVQAMLGLALFAIVIQVILIAPHAVKDHPSTAPAPNPETSAQPAATQDKVDQSIQGMHMIETQQGGKEWELWSEKADRLKDKDVLKLAQVKVIFFAKSGVTFNVTGDQGTVEVKTKNLRLQGNVVTKSSNGYTYTTEYLDYDSENKSLKTDSPVEMIGPPDKRGPGLKLTGRGMTAQMQEGSMEILNSVHAEKSFSEKKVDIRSHRALFTAHDRTARFLGDAILDFATMRITGPEARFDYDPKTEEIRHLTVIGAKVSDTDKWATADNLQVDFDTNKFIFRGHPRVVQNNDELKGEEIVFLDGGKRVQVHRARAKMDEKRMGKTD